MDVLSDPPVTEARLDPYPASENDLPIRTLAISLQIGFHPAEAGKALREQDLLPTRRP